MARFFIALSLRFLCLCLGIIPFLSEVFADDCAAWVKGLPSLFGQVSPPPHLRPEIRYPTSSRAFATILRGKSTEALQRLESDLKNFRLSSESLISLGIAVSNLGVAVPNQAALHQRIAEAKGLAAIELGKEILHTQEIEDFEDDFNQLDMLARDPDSAVIATKILIELYEKANEDIKDFIGLRLQSTYLHHELRMGRMKNAAHNANCAEARRLIRESPFVARLVENAKRSIVAQSEGMAVQISNKGVRELLRRTNREPRKLTEEEARAAFWALREFDYEQLRMLPLQNPLAESPSKRLLPSIFLIGLDEDGDLKQRTLELAARLLDFYIAAKEQSEMALSQEQAQEFLDRYESNLTEIKNEKLGSKAPSNLMEEERYRQYVFEIARAHVRDERTEELLEIQEMRVLSSDQILSLIDLANTLGFKQLPPLWIQNESKFRQDLNQRLAEHYPALRTMKRMTTAQQLIEIQRLSNTASQDPDFLHWLILLLKTQSLKREVQELSILFLKKISDSIKGELFLRGGQWFAPLHERAKSIALLGLGEIAAHVKLPLPIQESLAQHFQFHASGHTHTSASLLAEEGLAQMAVSPHVFISIRRFAKGALEQLKHGSNWLPLPSTKTDIEPLPLASPTGFVSMTYRQLHRLQTFMARAEREGLGILNKDADSILTLVNTTTSSDLNALFRLKLILVDAIANQSSDLKSHEMLEVTERAIERSYELNTRLFRKAKIDEMKEIESDLIEFGSRPELASYAVPLLIERLQKERHLAVALRWTKVLFQISDALLRQPLKSGFHENTVKQARTKIYDSLSSFIIENEAIHLKERTDNWRIGFEGRAAQDLERVSEVLNPKIPSPVPLINSKEGLALIEAQRLSKKYQSYYRLPEGLEKWIQGPSTKARERALRLLTGFKLLMEALAQYSGHSPEGFGADTVLAEYRFILNRLQ